MAGLLIPKLSPGWRALSAPCPPTADAAERKWATVGAVRLQRTCWVTLRQGRDCSGTGDRSKHHWQIRRSWAGMVYFAVNVALEPVAGLADAHHHCWFEGGELCRCTIL
jgi:hypothetical protein